MRVRTEEKRREIIEAAAALFVEQGYERTSMSSISERLGGSKATLYGYFASKDDLLRAVLEYDVSEEAERVLHEFPTDGNLRDGLIRLGIAYLTQRLADLPIANLRTVANQPPESTLGKEFYEMVLQPAWQELATRLEGLMDEGGLKEADPWVAAMHWKGLNEGELLEKRLLGAIRGPNPKEVRKVATLAADAFLMIYGVEKAGGAKTKRSGGRTSAAVPHKRHRGVS
jgi:AcrR family transcriptional regulator